MTVDRYKRFVPIETHPRYDEERESKLIFKILLALMLAGSLFMGWCLGIFIYSPLAIAETYICSTQKGTWVNIRSTPSPDGEKIGMLRYGYEIDAVEQDGYLKFTTRDGKTGYAAQQFFERPAHDRGTVVSRVVTRVKPNGRKINHLNPGSWIDILAYTKDENGVVWARCYGNVYVMAKYLEVSKR